MRLLCSCGALRERRHGAALHPWRLPPVRQQLGGAAVTAAARAPGAGGRPTGTGALQSCLRLPRLTPAPHTAASSQRARVSFSAAFPFLPPRLLQPISAPSSLFPPPVSLPEGDAWTLLRYYVFVFPIPCVEILVLHVEYRYVKYSSPFPSPPIPPAAVGCVCTDCFPCPVHCSAVGQPPPPFPVSPLPPEQRFVLCVRNSC